MTVGKLPNDDKEFADALANRDANEKAELAEKIDVPAIEVRRAAVRHRHDVAFAHVLNEYVPLALEKGVDVDLSGVSRLTYQLFRSQEDIR